MLKRGISMIVGTLLSMCYIVASPFLPTKTEIIETGKLVNGYWIKNHSQGGNNDWARSVYYVGNTCFYKYFGMGRKSSLEIEKFWARSCRCPGLRTGLLGFISVGWRKPD